MVSRVGFSVEFHINPFTRGALLAANLRRETVAINRIARRFFRPRKIDERCEEIAEIGEIVIYLASRRRAGPVDDQGHSTAALEHLSFPAANRFAVDLRDL